MVKSTSRIPTSVAAIAAAAVIAACGSSSPTPHSSGAATTSATFSGAVAYARCMRSHGVAGFPDPSSSGANSKQGIVRALQQAGNSRAQAAQTACMHINAGSPGTGGGSGAPTQARTAAFLAFARCIRRHGLANFPDPSPSGELTQQMVTDAGINMQQPAVVQAADACVGVTHGLITKAIVARFIAGS